MGLILAVAALYGGLAFALEDSRRTAILPTMRARAGDKALGSGTLSDQISGVYQEAGVRHKL